jgi:hypothetical protein
MTWKLSMFYKTTKGRCAQCIGIVDIIRRAMVRMDGALEEAGLAARMLLQVHAVAIACCCE